MRRMFNLAATLVAGAGAASVHAAGPAVRLEPFPPLAGGSPEASVTVVQNHYGRCGPSVVQVLGVERQVGDFFTVDAAAGNARVVVIAEGGRRSLVLQDVLSDQNGVACLASGQKPYLLIWSKCAGTACGDDFNFTVVDVERLRLATDKSGQCDAPCAAHITGSQIPLQIGKSK